MTVGRIEANCPRKVAQSAVGEGQVDAGWLMHCELLESLTGSTRPSLHTHHNICLGNGKG
jgi:hypothetical protein